MLGADIEVSTLGLLGLGRTGARMACIGNAFGMRVTAWSPNLTIARAAACQAEHVTKGEPFARSDVISVHLVLSESTMGIVGAREISAMRSSAWLVNTSRADLVDQHALLDALRAGEHRRVGDGRVRV